MTAAGLNGSGCVLTLQYEPRLRRSECYRQIARSLDMAAGDRSANCSIPAHPVQYAPADLDRHGWDPASPRKAPPKYSFRRRRALEFPLQTTTRLVGDDAIELHSEGLNYDFGSAACKINMLPVIGFTRLNSHGVSKHAFVVRSSFPVPLWGL